MLFSFQRPRAFSGALHGPGGQKQGLSPERPATEPPGRPSVVDFSGFPSLTLLPVPLEATNEYNTSRGLYSALWTAVSPFPEQYGGPL